ncbi:hypothetical protein GGX14DRAFT_523982 [Mycena pura]|uniref:G domain-containing protein n=1 Tax=Mycena pura TaxID=153505 RepID=A0AAD6YAJ0_9AGAR|nr:hypothetical protein GGX14DRAFT_523982 [Mycena pura]
MEKAIDLRSKCRHFRVLVIGRANAGKTTILKKVCNTVEDPEIFRPSGEKIDLAAVEGSAERGLHNIDDQLIFKSNPQFIFHDSRGFESGSAEEVKKVEIFIAQRAAARDLSRQLHAIWYCLPTDTNRPLLETDEQFFKKHGTGKVIAIFTKFDGLVTKAFQQLRAMKSLKEAKTESAEQAQKMLTTDFIIPLKATNFAPSDYVHLGEIQIRELIQKTATALTDDTLPVRLLFVSVQQNNIDVCARYAVKWQVDLQCLLVLC